MKSYTYDVIYEFIFIWNTTCNYIWNHTVSSLQMELHHGSFRCIIHWITETKQVIYDYSLVINNHAVWEMKNWVFSFMMQNHENRGTVAGWPWRSQWLPRCWVVVAAAAAETMTVTVTPGSPAEADWAAGSAGVSPAAAVPVAAAARPRRQPQADAEHTARSRGTGFTEWNWTWTSTVRAPSRWQPVPGEAAAGAPGAGSSGGRGPAALRLLARTTWKFASRQGDELDLS